MMQGLQQHSSQQPRPLSPRDSGLTVNSGPLAQKQGSSPNEPQCNAFPLLPFRCSSKIVRMSLPCTPLTASGRISGTPRTFTSTPLLLPKVSQAVIPLSVNQCGQRINPLHPPGVKRRTVSLETFAAHHHNQQRAVVMQQKEYNRYHQSWQRPFYGSVAEKEEYRREIRQLLKRQMSQQWESQRYALFNRAKEGEAAREAERQATLQDLEKQSARSRFLRAFRDENKKLMEIQWKEKRLAKSLDSLRERELLQYNPINWSCTLK
ncbi:uncharacterized protein LOC109927078 isoform X2 [Rhincodon typus]|nr:uncharacterized protein LOC109927078 isoform X2 [Rhincodon typus]